jgi:hypothetical protein
MRDHEALVTIASFDTSFEASLARAALERIGVPAFVPDEATGTFAWYSRQRGSSGAVLQVFESDRDRAIAELRRINMQIVRPPSESA